MISAAQLRFKAMAVVGFLALYLFLGIYSLFI